MVKVLSDISLAGKKIYTTLPVPDMSKYLPLTGGTISGNLSVTNDFEVSGDTNVEDVYVSGEIYKDGVPLVIETIPIGSILPYPGTTAPNGWLLMGPDYSRTAYPELFNVIGTKFGAGDGSTTFGTNIKGRVFVGLDTSQTEFNTIGKIGGHKLLQAHSHNMGDDAYGGYTNYMGVRGDGGGSNHAVPNYSQTSSNSVYKPLSTGGGDSQNLQPYIVTNRIIKAFNVAATNPASTVIDNLISPSPTDSLSANQGKVLNEKINNLPKISYISGTTSLSFTPTFDCLIDIELIDSCWGYGGGTVTISISNPIGGATQILNKNCKGVGADIVSRALVARAVYQCTKGTSYTFSREIANNGGESSVQMIGQIIPR